MYSTSNCNSITVERARQSRVTIADGTSHEVPYVGPIRIDFENRLCFAGAIVMGKESLLGAIPMEDMNLLVHPAMQKRMANPLHPNKPSYTIK